MEFGSELSISGEDRSDSDQDEEEKKSSQIRVSSVSESFYDDEEDKVPNDEDSRSSRNIHLEKNIFIDLSKIDPLERNRTEGYYCVFNQLSGSSSFRDSNIISKITEYVQNNGELDSIKNSNAKSFEYYNQRLPKNSEATRYLDPIQLYKRVTRRTIGGWEEGKEYELKDFMLYLDLDKESGREIISKSHRLNRIPDINELWINNVHTEYYRDVNDFLQNVAPNKIEKFGFIGDNINNLLDVSFYLEGLHEVLKSTTKEVLFYRCKYSCSELQSIFIAAKHVKRMFFNSCKLDATDGFDIKEQMFKTEVLELWSCSEYNNWVNNSDGLEILMGAVAHSSLKQSLREILIWEKWESKTEYKVKIKEIFERHDLQDVLRLT